MSDFKVGAVITTIPGRLDNLGLVISNLGTSRVVPEHIVVIGDGCQPWHIETGHDRVTKVCIEKHHPGAEQPRNVGVRELLKVMPDATHVWFVDSDILVDIDTLAEFKRVGEANPDAILIGPYDWMPQAQRSVQPEIRNDPRWAMFEERGEAPTQGELGVGLGNFGGNLVWPIAAFIEVGGFHPQLHHGRCEDGELGLRAASHGTPMCLVAGARGYHLWHDVDGTAAMERNSRDVPLLNSWHPWVEVKCKQCGERWRGELGKCEKCGCIEHVGGLIVAEADGARFDFVCECGAQVNTLEMWEHMSTAHGRQLDHPLDADLIMPPALEAPRRPIGHKQDIAAAALADALEEADKSVTNAQRQALAQFEEDVIEPLQTARAACYHIAALGVNHKGALHLESLIDSAILIAHDFKIEAVPRQEVESEPPDHRTEARKFADAMGWQ